MACAPAARSSGEHTAATAATSVPALALNAQNDPFVPAASLPRAGEVGRHVTLWQPPEGGHVGFCQGRAPGHVFWLPRAVGGWLLAQAEVPARAGHASS